MTDDPGQDPTKDQPDDDRPDVQYDPDGLGLARQVARRVNSGTPAPQQRRKRPRRRPVDPLSSGARPDDRDPQLIGNVLHRLVEERGWRTEMDIHVLMARWPELVGRANASHSRAETYEDGVLTIRTSSTAWAVQMRNIAPAVVARINKQMGSDIVSRVVVKGPDVPTWNHGRLRVKGRGPRDTYG